MWYAKATGSYSRDSTEGKANATELANALINEGWSINSVCAMLGNGAGESGLNPWRWESDDVPTYSEYQSWTDDEALSHGYGLFGFTPASKYIEGGKPLAGYAPNFSDSPGSPSDGNAQTLYFKSTVQGAWSQGLYDYYKDDFAAIGVNIDDFYFMTFNEFTAGNDTLENLTGAFELLYEKPADWAAASSYAHRVDSAKYWANYFNANPPTPTPVVKRLPIWFYLKNF